MRLLKDRDLSGILKNRNWGLKLLAAVLAIVIYYAIKTESANRAHMLTAPHDETTFDNGANDKTD